MGHSRGTWWAVGLILLAGCQGQTTDEAAPGELTPVSGAGGASGAEAGAAGAAAGPSGEAGAAPQAGHGGNGNGQGGAKDGQSGAPGAPGGASGEVGGASGEAGGAGGSAAGAAGSAGAGVVAMVSFRDEVIPIFHASCVVGGCHGDDSYITPKLGPATAYTAAEVHSFLMDPGAIGQTLITPGSPAGSFLMNKLHGDFTGLACNADKSCGLKMPKKSKGNQPITAAEIQTISDWISQGALDN